MRIPLTGLRNRLGVEYQLRKWWRDDPERQRLMSVALIDFDRLGKTNEFASTRVADRIIQALAHLLKQQVSRDSGFDRVFRYNGHQFLLFFGDIGHGTADGDRGAHPAGRRSRVVRVPRASSTR